MALNPEALGYTPPGVNSSVITSRVNLDQEKPVPLGKPRPAVDAVGSIDWADFAERSTPAPDILPVGDLTGFAAYRKGGGIFSKDLYKTVMEEVIKLQEPGVRENSNFSSGTKSQIRGFEERHNKPFLSNELPPEEQIFLSQPQKDAYCLLRENLTIPAEDRRTEAYSSDVLMFEQILKMPSLASFSSLKSYKLSEQKQSRALPAAA